MTVCIEGKDAQHEPFELRSRRPIPMMEEVPKGALPLLALQWKHDFVKEREESEGEQEVGDDKGEGKKTPYSCLARPQIHFAVCTQI